MATHATQALRDEHQIILAVLDCLAALAERARTAGEVETAALRQVIDFLRSFADRCHHAKEEGVLFPALARAGMPRERGPVAVMLHEHEVGRGHVGALEKAVASVESGDARAREAVVEHAAAFVELLRAHIGKEDHVLFEMADQILPPDEQVRVAEDFVAHEREALEPAARERCLRGAEELCARWGVDLRAPRSAPLPC